MEVSRTQLAIIGAFLVSIACLITAPVVLPENYSVVEHTISEAAAQSTEGAWLARTGIFLFGLGVFWLGVSKRTWALSARIVHGAFGILMIAAAVYSHRPMLDGVDYDRLEDTLHVMASTSMAVAFAVGVVIVGWRRVSGWKLIDFVALAAAVGIPFAMASFTGWAGWLHRAMFIIAYLWYLLEVIDTHRSVALDAFG